VAKGVGPVFSEGQKIPSKSRWDVSWLMMSGINQMIGGIAGKPEPLYHEELN
jgi:NCS1 family nucleobase:cation symporter-1